MDGLSETAEKRAVKILSGVSSHLLLDVAMSSFSGISEGKPEAAKAIANLLDMPESYAAANISSAISPLFPGDGGTQWAVAGAFNAIGRRSLIAAEYGDGTSNEQRLAGGISWLAMQRDF